MYAQVKCPTLLTVCIFILVTVFILETVFKDVKDLFSPLCGVVYVGEIVHFFPSNPVQSLLDSSVLVAAH